MDGGFCGGQFWDLQTTWNTTEPDFTPCFQKTVVLWVPCAYLILFTPLRVYSLSRDGSAPIPFTWLNILKTVISGWIAVMAVAEIAKSIHELVSEQVVKTVDFVSPLVLCVTMMLSILVTHHERRRGVHSSGFLFCFWFLLCISLILIFQSKVRMAAGDGVADVFRFVTFHLYFPAVLVQFVLCLISDKVPEFQEVSTGEKPCPEGRSTFLSRITFWWFTGLVVQGYKKALERVDLWLLNSEDTSATVVPHFDRCWQKQVDRAKRKQEQQSIRNTQASDGIEIRSLNKDGTTYTEVSVVDGKKLRPAKLLNAMVVAYGPMCLMTALYKLIFDVFQFLSPLILKLLIQFTRNKEEYMWRGFFYAGLMFFVAVLQSFILHQYFHGCQLLGMRIRTALISSVYRKMLNLSNAARRNATVGEIVNLMSVDAQRFMDLMTYLHTIWSGPFQIIVALYFLYQELGASIFAGFAVMVVLIPINALIAKKTRDLQVQQMTMKDTRIKLMNEVLNGIKVLKLYAWEPSFEEKILAIRNKELKVLRTMAILNACVSFTWTTAPFIVSLVTFAVYVLSDVNNILDAEKAFVSLSLFNILRFPMSMLPQVISNIVQTAVSLKRLQAFLNNEELDPNAVQRDQTSKHAITVNKAAFTWDHDTETTLKDISLEVPDGALVAVVGSVGSGKSSLLSAILGEMEKIKGSVNVKGSVAYVAQQAWIQNATLQNNVLFGRPLLQDEYDSVIDGCALKQDLDILPGGDQTEIGEKGINLSGGQKQRVSLARAVYQNADIYLFDDPLSAVDSHVGKHIFDHVISSNGLLKDKTRILVTHGISFLPKVDLIVVLVNGEISEVGTFQELMTHAGAFADFLKNYLANELENEENMEADLNDIEDLKMAEDIVSQLGSIMEDEGTKSLQRQVSKLSRMQTLSQSDSKEDVRTRTYSEMSGQDKTLTSSHSSLAKSGDIPQIPGSPSTKRPPLKKQQSEFCHPSEKIKEKEAVIKQVEEKKKEDKLIQAEKVETGKVKLNVFYAYLKSIGLFLSVIIILFYILYNASSVYSNIWLSEWSNDRPIVINGTNGTITTKVDTNLRDLRLGVYGALGFLQGFVIVVASLSLYLGNVKSGRILHRLILNNILASPMAFFDTTPQGRIMNRFSKDVDVLDTVIPRTFEAWLACFLRVISVPIVIGYSTPLFLIGFIPLTVLYIVVQVNV